MWYFANCSTRYGEPRVFENGFASYTLGCKNWFLGISIGRLNQYGRKRAKFITLIFTSFFSDIWHSFHRKWKVERHMRKNCFCSAYRTKSLVKSSNQQVPVAASSSTISTSNKAGFNGIIIKFNTLEQRFEFFHQYHKYKDLNLNLIGFQTPARI